GVGQQRQQLPVQVEVGGGPGAEGQGHAATAAGRIVGVTEDLANPALGVAPEAGAVIGGEVVRRGAVGADSVGVADQDGVVWIRGGGQSEHPLHAKVVKAQLVGQRVARRQQEDEDRGGRRGQDQAGSEV